MGQKLTLGFKKEVCRHCNNCDKRALRQGRNHCSLTYKPQNGHCANFRLIDKNAAVQGQEARGPEVSTSSEGLLPGETEK